VGSANNKVAAAPAWEGRKSAAAGPARLSVSRQQPNPRHARPYAGHPRIDLNKKTWMAGTSPAMTKTM
jgi:hypothetical protein